MLKGESPKQKRRGSKGSRKGDHAINSDVVKTEEGERGRMKYLNNHLAEYMSRVQELKAANKRLEAENKKCLKRINEPKPDYYAMHWGELQKLREKIQNLQKCKKLVEVERDGLACRLKETEEKSKSTRECRAKAEKEVKKKIAEAKESALEKMNLENEFDSQSKQIELLKRVHEGEVHNLQRQFDASESAMEVQSERSFCVADMNDAIEDVRAEYAEYNAKALSDKDEQYKEKIEQLNKTLSELQEENEKLLGEKSERTNVNEKLEVEAEITRKEHEAVTRNVAFLRDRLRQEREDQEKVLAKLDADIASTKKDLSIYLKEYQELNALKLSLEQEIDDYNKLLIDDDLKSDESGSLSSSSSRSSLRSSSQSSSRSSSRKSSPERSSLVSSGKSSPKQYTKTRVTRYKDKDSDPVVEEFEGRLFQEEVEKLALGCERVEVQMASYDQKAEV